MTLEPGQQGAVTRRHVLVGAGVAAGAVLAAACGDGTTTESGAGGGDGGAAGGGAGSTLATVADVPVGGAVSAKGPDGRPVIVSQPTKGDIVALSAICTHKGCTVAPQGSQLECPCHGSTYDLTGQNTGGPAPSPLPRIPVQVTGGKVVTT